MHSVVKILTGDRLGEMSDHLLNVQSTCVYLLKGGLVECHWALPSYDSHGHHLGKVC